MISKILEIQDYNIALTPLISDYSKKNICIYGHKQQWKPQLKKCGKTQSCLGWCKIWHFETKTNAAAHRDSTDCEMWYLCMSSFLVRFGVTAVQSTSILWYQIGCWIVYVQLSISHQDSHVHILGYTTGF